MESQQSSRGAGGCILNASPLQPPNAFALRDQTCNQRDSKGGVVEKYSRRMKDILVTPVTQASIFNATTVGKQCAVRRAAVGLTKTEKLSF